MFSRFRGKKTPAPKKDATAAENATVEPSSTEPSSASGYRADSPSPPTSPALGSPKTPTSLATTKSPKTPSSSRGRGFLGMFGNKGDGSSQKRETLEKTADSTLPTSDGNVIIFDWDDTLCPTWWVWNVLAFGVQGEELEAPIPNDPKMQVILKTTQELSRPTSKFCADLQEHARTVEALLRNSRSIGHVSIVTMGSQPWFENSAVFFPGLDVPGLLDELGISVHFAVIPDVVPDGMDLKVAAKRAAITECLIKHYGIGTVRWNVLSVGDQPEEREALKLCCRACPHRLRRKPICKSFTVEAEPMLKDMTANLKRMHPIMAQLVAHDKDNDWDFKTTNFSS